LGLWFTLDADLRTLDALSPEAEIYMSMQKPRKFFMLDQQGRATPFLAKPNDDLRQDQRLMESCLLVNRLLRSDSSTRSAS